MAKSGFMPSTKRLKEYAEMKGPAGESRDMRNLDYWANRATDNSQLAPRARGGEVRLPSTGKQVLMRDTASAPKVTRKADAAVSGKTASPDVRRTALSDTRSYGSTYMKGVRRET